MSMGSKVAAGLMVMAVVAGVVSYALHRIEQKGIARAVEVLRKEIPNGDSALFRNLHVGVNKLTVCGEVNAKNAYGSYIAYVPFVVYLPSRKDKSAVPLVRLDRPCE